MGREVRIGVDVGGTFTDTIALDSSSGRILSYNKTDTIPSAPNKSFLRSLRKLKINSGMKLTIFHATTLATNIIRGQKQLNLPRVALIATKGFKDIIEIGRQKRPKLYDLKFSKPTPLVPRELRFEVDERITYEGKIIKPLNKQEVLEIGKKLRDLGVESLAISLLHSYANPIHEKLIEDIIRELIPNLHISASYRVNPEHREYERTSTTVVNALLKPLIKSYLETLVTELREFGETMFLMIQSNGGLASPEEVVELPVGIIESGPAAGLMATKFIGELLGEGNLLGFDMGGTTAKAGTITNYQPTITNEYEVGGEAHMGRIIKGSGYPVRFPFIELSEVSAGGGTIIWIDEAGALKVGPISAGADPGPASYGRGGDKPTITDAHLLLGRLNPKHFLGGEMEIYPSLAEKAFKKEVSDAIGLDPIEASIGAIRIINTIMSRGISISTIERGIDPRELTMVAYGGAGPLHACELAEDLGFKKVVVPPHPGLFSALGLLSVDLKYSGLRSVRGSLDELDISELQEFFGGIEKELMEKLKRVKMEFIEIYSVLSLDMRYWGQGYELNIKLPNRSVSTKEIKELFHKAHRHVYGYSMDEEDVEIVNVRVDVVGVINKPKLPKIEESKQKHPEPYTTREVYYHNIDEFEESKIFVRDKLKRGHIIYGPAVVEEYDSTIIIPLGWVAEVGEYGEIILGKGE